MNWPFTRVKKNPKKKNRLELDEDLRYKASSKAPVAQLDRVSDYESGGHRFESCLVYQENQGVKSLAA
jgi:hypothetical protein